MYAIEAQSLKKTYSKLFGHNSKKALDGVDLAVPSGIAFGLIGLNGAGKTTFIKAILDIVKLDQGEISVLGSNPEDPKTRARIGYLPERLEISNAWTPKSFLYSIARLKGLKDFEDEVRTQIDHVGLAPEAEHRVGSFSKGMKRRLGVAAALIGSPDLLILDEPTDGIDPIGRLEIRRLLSAARDRGATIFINSHLLTETERFCDQIGIIHLGKIIRQGSMSELCGDINRWRIQFEPGCDKDALTDAGFIKGNNEENWLFETIDTNELNAALDKARASGALLVGLSPDHRQLDEILSEAVGGRP